MADLVYYRTEHIEFIKYYDNKLPNPRYKSIRIVIEKLYKHFKLGIPNLQFTSGWRHSKWSPSRIVINIDHASFGLVAHEVGHALAYKKFGTNVGHTKKHRSQMIRILAYLQKKKFFNDELTKRLATKPEKLKPTKDQERDQRINKAKEKILRYKKKLRLYTRKLSRAKRSLSMLQKYKKVIEIKKTLWVNSQREELDRNESYLH